MTSFLLPTYNAFYLSTVSSFQIKAFSIKIQKNKSFYIFFIYIMSTLLYTQDIRIYLQLLAFFFSTILYHDCSSNPGCYFMKVFHQTQCITHRRHILATHQPVRVLSTTRQILSRLHKKYCY